MKKIALGMITILLFGIKTIKAQELELSDSEPISNGCLSRSTEEEASALPTIKLTKEGSILYVDLLNYSSNCSTFQQGQDNSYMLSRCLSSRVVHRA